TTGFATADFNVWPALSKSILLILMFIGACAGSTGGGFKVSRVLILAKSFKQEIIRLLHPRSVITVKMDGKALDKETVRQVAVYAAVYVGVFVASFLLLNVFEEHDMETTISAVTACYNNIGPGFSLVGPMANYSFFGVPAKLILIFDMLAGRLELYPILILFVPEVWKKARKQAEEDMARRKRYKGKGGLA
ncbi:MAG: TrkH family potassium uptake protein, partial [Lachnospiraceae bacterium]|nr:TrkH family potassium uptake protein [Lachnospiraceae bacterium]